MKNQKFEGLFDLSYQEKLEITGGDTGYYGKGPDLNLLVDRVETAAGFVYGFFRSLI